VTHAGRTAAYLVRDSRENGSIDCVGGACDRLLCWPVADPGGLIIPRGRSTHLPIFMQAADAGGRQPGAAGYISEETGGRQRIWTWQSDDGGTRGHGMDRSTDIDRAAALGAPHREKALHTSI